MRRRAGRVREEPDSAAAWFARAQSGRMTSHEGEALEAWLSADPVNRTTFEQLANMWSGLEPARRNPRIMAARENADIWRRWRTALTYGAPLAAAAVVGVMAVTAFQMVQGIPLSYRTGVGHSATIRLTDGSTVVLDTDSAIRVWPRLRPERRIELLRGRAHFEVAKDQNRPFIVRTQTGSVTALGTAFDVSLQAAGMKVVLVEGTVRVQPGTRQSGRAVVLHHGEQLVASRAGWRQGPVDTRIETSWLGGNLIFDEQPLSVVVEEINRYSEKKIEIADVAVGQRRLSAVLRLGDTAALVTAVKDMNLAKADYSRHNVITLSRP